MAARGERRAWVSYLRVSTPEQADRELSLPAQRRAVEDYARRHDASIEREYVEPGSSGVNRNRRVFRQMLEDVLRPGSDVSTIVVHHTSRFTRNSTEARVVKSKLRRIGVRVVSASHELSDDPIGKLMEGLLECFDQYESEINGMRTAAAMSEAVRQDTSRVRGLLSGFRPSRCSRVRASRDACCSRYQRKSTSFAKSSGSTLLLAVPKPLPAS